MQELNDSVSKAHAEQDEFAQRTKFYRDAEKYCDGFRGAFEQCGELKVVTGKGCERGAVLECPPSLASLLWLVMRQWQITEKQNLVQELTSGE